MSRTAILNFQSRVRELNKEFEEIHLPSIEKYHAKMQSLSDNALEGQGRELMTEAQVKACLLDPLLSCLQWDISNLDSILVEAPVAPLTSDNKRRFLDYHGCEINDDSKERSLLVIEAKRPSVSLPGDASKPDDLLVAEVVEALKWISSGKTKKKGLTADWIDRLATLSDYVKRIYSTYSHAPFMAVITNGEWFVIFNNPETTFIVSAPSVDDIIVFRDLNDIEARANEFYSHLAYVSLSKHIPIQHPSDLIKFVQPGSTVYVALAIELVFSNVKERQPIIAIRLFAKVRTSKKNWIVIQQDYKPPYELLRHEYDGITENKKYIRTREQELIDELRKCANVILLSPKEYEVLLNKDEVEFKWPSTSLCEALSGNTYVLNTCNESFLLTTKSDFDECPYHSFGNCSSIGNAAANVAIYSPSVSPKAYFPSGSIYHCAHKSVHTLRDKDCVILPIDVYFCCQRCVFFERCWPDGGNKLPCVNRDGIQPL